jgi:hypothetical protein
MAKKKFEPPNQTASQKPLNQIAAQRMQIKRMNQEAKRRKAMSSKMKKLLLPEMILWT